ncbi:YpbF family protein [Cytobacillus purgationiresistens]|uniref:DUF2663 family protein n=1 Tax=Cytobacillus purgationiresistens TaxID=863449 RepID=A0ABU0AL51_9BACI|nr:YpbF family protein [Cytobacillus purgationiresistens]MDQ0271113.1 hypothetical protein [Cytobacillus purgationiresistens]
METAIMMLDERTDQATRQMLQKVVERKNKFDKLKEWHLLVMWAVVLLSFIYFAYLFYQVLQPYSYSFAAMFSVFVNQTFNLYCLITIIGLFGWMNVLRQKREKAEKEYQALRCEIIDKSKDLWKKEEEWKNRHIVYNMMKKNYDINLFHENK